MHKTPPLTENETVVEYFSSKTVHAAREKKAFRRTLIVVVLWIRLFPQLARRDKLVP